MHTRNIHRYLILSGPAPSIVLLCQEPVAMQEERGLHGMGVRISDHAAYDVTEGELQSVLRQGEDFGLL